MTTSLSGQKKKKEKRSTVKDDDVDDDDDDDDDDEKNSKRPKLCTTTANGSNSCNNDYNGYSFQTIFNPSIDIVDLNQYYDTTGRTFFDDYIAQRKPCILKGIPFCSNKITKQLLVDLAGERTIQVERRTCANENFGQNRTISRQIVLTVQELLNKMIKRATSSCSSGDSKEEQDDEGSLLYWSTQEDTDDPYNVPCRQLVDANIIPAQLLQAGNLVLSSCNLWLGKTLTTTNTTTAAAAAAGEKVQSQSQSGQSQPQAQGASSGLHHDYHDNFYILLKGRKRFRLLSPDCAPYLAVYGQIDKIHNNGRISYRNNETRADGVPLSELQNNNGDDDDADNEKEEDEDAEEEELVLGKGFDYVSDDSDANDGFDECNQKDDFDELVGTSDEDDEDDELVNDEAKNNKMTKNNQEEDRPDSFSRIDPNRTDRDVLEQEFPGFASCKQVMVNLEAGQMLYLPAGWFHEVTSYSYAATKKEKESDPLSDCHMAINYWYHPPDATNNYEKPYKDNFWKKEEEQRRFAKK